MSMRLTTAISIRDLHFQSPYLSGYFFKAQTVLDVQTFKATTRLEVSVDLLRLSVSIYKKGRARKFQREKNYKPKKDFAYIYNRL